MTAVDDTSGSKRNIILGYARVEEIAVSMERMNGKLDSLGTRITDLANIKVDHEIRLRTLELSNATYIAAATRGTSVWQWVWGALTAGAMVVLGTINIYLK